MVRHGQGNKGKEYGNIPFKDSTGYISHNGIN